MVEITSEEQNKVRRMKRTEGSLRDLSDNIKHTNIRIIGVQEEEETKKGYEKMFEEIIVENFPNMEKEIVNQVQEAQRIPYKINPRRNTPRHILSVSHSVMLTLCGPMECSPPGSCVHEIFQARILEWGAIFFSRSL